MNPDQLLTEAQVAEWLGVTRRTVQRWRERRQVAYLVIPAGGIRYRADDLARRVEARRPITRGEVIT